MRHLSPHPGMRSVASAIALTLLLASAVVGLPSAATAAPTLHTSSDGQYTFYCEGGGLATLESYLGAGGAVVVPATVTSDESGTCDVTEIGVATFRDAGLTSVQFSSKVTILGAAFTGNHIEFVSLASSGTGTTNIPAGAFADQTVDGRAVLSWTDQDERSVPSLDGSFTSGSFHAKTEQDITHPVTFEPENGEPATTVTVNDGDPVAAPEIPSRPPLEPGAESVQFLGWTQSLEGDSGPYDFDTPVTDDLTLYAVWRQVPKEVHTVTFVPNTVGSDDPSFSVEVVDGDAVDEPAAPTPYAATPSIRFNFRGWGQESGLYDFDTPVTSDLVLTGAWTKVETESVQLVKVSTIKLTSPLTIRNQSQPPLSTLTPGSPLTIGFSTFGNIGPRPIDDPISNLVLQGRNQISVSGCATLGGLPSLAMLGADPSFSIGQVPNPGCLSGQGPSVITPPYSGPLPPRGTMIKLCQVFCYGSARVSVESTPQFLGTMAIDEVGQGSLTVTLPSDLPPGQHTIVIDLGGEREVRHPITVHAADDTMLPATGTHESPSTLAAGLAMVVLGGAMLVVACRRHEPDAYAAR